MMLARDIPKPETYGVPTVYAAGDVNRDGVCDGFDPQDWDDYNDYGVGALAVDLDINRDGVVDSAGRALVQGHADWLLWTSHGRGSVSRLHNRRGYAGYEYDPATQQWHVRHRVLVSEMGRWNRRDPLGYVDGMSVYEYVGSMAVLATDPSGLITGHCTTTWFVTEYRMSPTWGPLERPVPGKSKALFRKIMALLHCCTVHFPNLMSVIHCTIIDTRVLRLWVTVGSDSPPYYISWRDDFGCESRCAIELYPTWTTMDHCRAWGGLCIDVLPQRTQYPVTPKPPVAPAVGPK
ncbi:MAG: hypothetical protein KF859_06465 [Phycisphaeraceae bacterium]|nr:hypothetical protein [Phycisphaeraceae bacterium]